MIYSKTKGRGVADSTRSAILLLANRMISEVGVADFKIDMLSTSLSLSPGNITYHFPKKEDIATALWDRVVQSVSSSIANYLTPILDIKQLFLLLRTIFVDNSEYRGVVAYKLGDLNILRDTTNRYIGSVELSVIDNYVRNIVTTLQQNGYLKRIPNDELAMVKQSIIQVFFWGFLDFSIISETSNSESSAAQLYATLVLHPLYGYLSNKGMEQFGSVVSIRDVTVR